MTERRPLALIGLDRIVLARMMTAPPGDERSYELPDLAGVIDRPAWVADALCREHPELPWFPERGVDPKRVAAARAVCARCAVRVECQEQGAGEPAGIWGGTTPNVRRSARRRPGQRPTRLAL